MHALILAAGLGTRLKPFTDKHPKALAPVNGKTVLQRNIEYLQGFDIRDVMVNVHHFADQIVDAIRENNGWGSEITISDETGAVLETGGGIKKAGWFLQQTEPSVVMNADILTDLPLDAMIDNHKKYLPLATLATTSRVSSRYLMFDEQDMLVGWKNDKTGEVKGRSGVPKAFSGIHILSKDIFEKLTMEGKFSIIDMYLQLCSHHTIRAFDHSEGTLVDIGTMDKLAHAETVFH